MSFTIMMDPRGLSKEDHQKLVLLTEVAIENFDSSDWKTLGARTNLLDYINNHNRLLRSLSWEDDDYEGCAHTVMSKLATMDQANLQIIEDYVTSKYGNIGENISTALSKSRTITFSPSVFDVPDCQVDQSLVAVMSPFAAEFEKVFRAIDLAAATVGYRVLRAKDIWQHSTVIQDVFSLIFEAKIVVCDFTGKNPNVFYEAGIAHTLGKHVVPITQNADDIPFDLRHHRFLPYLNNGEGRVALEKALAERFNTLR